MNEQINEQMTAQMIEKIPIMTNEEAEIETIDCDICGETITVARSLVNNDGQIVCGRCIKLDETDEKTGGDA
jgi:formylmethanofuran dehydrogenase subunit E